MYTWLIFLQFLQNFIFSACHEEGPPPTDGGTFNQYTYYYDVYINETTQNLLDLDPKIENIYALYMHGNIRISERELTNFFRNIRVFEYGIRVNNTNLRSLEFLKPYIVNNLDNTGNSIEIMNNPNLTSLGIDFVNCNFCYDSIRITNNPMLNLRTECDNIIYRYSTNREITDNLGDCGCTIKGLFNKYVEVLPETCWWLVGNVTIDQNSNYTLLQEKLSNVTRISGGITVSKTNFIDLAFFKSLEKVEVNAQIANVLPSIIITNNPLLESLGMSPTRDGLYLTIRENPKLCVLAQELNNLFVGLSLDSNIDINICFNNDTPSNICEVAAYSALMEYPDGCTHLVGDLIINADYDYTFGYKLFDVEEIYGSLTITNSLLRNTNMLFHLKALRSVKDKIPPIVISNNTKLKSFVAPTSLESNAAVTIADNPNLVVGKTDCQLMRTQEVPIIRNNLSNCNSTDKKPAYDMWPLNTDVFDGVPKYSNVIPVDSLPADGETHNNPGNSLNDTDYYEEEVEPGKDDNHSNLVPIFVTILIIVLFVERQH